MNDTLTTATLPEDSDSTRDMLATIQEQGRLTLELVKTIVVLMTPKNSSRDGPTLEEMLAKIMTQQLEIIAIGNATLTNLDQLGEALPDVVAGVVRDRRVLNS